MWILKLSNFSQRRLCPQRESMSVPMVKWICSWGPSFSPRGDTMQQYTKPRYSMQVLTQDHSLNTALNEAKWTRTPINLDVFHTGSGRWRLSMKMFIESTDSCTKCHKSLGDVGCQIQTSSHLTSTGFHETHSDTRDLTDCEASTLDIWQIVKLPISEIRSISVPKAWNVQTTSWHMASSFGQPARAGAFLGAGCAQQTSRSQW